MSSFRLIAIGTACVICAHVSVSDAIAQSTGDAAGKSRPNFVVVLADDLGYGDLGCYGNTIVKTPHIDQFAREGLRLTSCYAAAANCSPARTGLMTGRTPYRVGVHSWIPYGSPMHVRKREITVATLLRQAGYTTCQVGKWHMNGMFNQPGQPQPSDHGFDHWFATQNNALPNHKDPENFVRNGVAVGRIEGYSAGIVVNEAKCWLNTGRDKQKPFFLYVCFHEPHEPIATAPRFSADYPSDDPSYSAYYGNIAQMDAACGELMKTLDDARLRDNTFVLFTSDNGPAITSIHPHGSAGPLRSKKGSMYEGGIRVPGILRGPGHTRPGSESDEPVSGVDLLPTLCAIAGISPPADRALDGASILPVLRQDPVRRTTPLYWQFNYASSEPKVAVRIGDWKVLATLDQLPPRSNDITPEAMQAIKTAELERFELYDLESDVAESNDVSAAHPQRLSAMRASLGNVYLQVRTETPEWPAWKFLGYERDRIVWPEYRRRKRTTR